MILGRLSPYLLISLLISLAILLPSVSSAAPSGAPFDFYAVYQKVVDPVKLGLTAIIDTRMSGNGVTKA